jgi:hypothetical protein
MLEINLNIFQEFSSHLIENSLRKLFYERNHRFSSESKRNSKRKRRYVTLKQAVHLVTVIVP